MASFIGGLVIVFGTAWKIWSMLGNAARQVNNPVNWPVLPTVPTPNVAAPLSPPVETPTGHPHVEGMRKWVAMRKHLQEVGMAPDSIQKIGQEIVQNFAVEPATPDA